MVKKITNLTLRTDDVTGSSSTLNVMALGATATVTLMNPDPTEKSPACKKQDVKMKKKLNYLSSSSRGG